MAHAYMRIPAIVDHSTSLMASPGENYPQALQHTILQKVSFILGYDDSCDTMTKLSMGFATWYGAQTDG